MDKVVIKPGLLAYALSLSSLTFGGYLLWTALHLTLSPQKEQVTINETLLSAAILLGIVAVGGILIWFSLSLLTQKYIVSLHGVHTRRLRNSRFVSWKDVRFFNEVPTLFGVSSYFVQLHDKSSAVFYTPFMAQPRHSAKALIEAAYLSGADIEFNFVLGNEFGPPPYGIFTTQQPERSP